MNRSEIDVKLTEAGHRTTSARGDVIDALLAYAGHMTADDLYESMRTSGSAVGRMTVFRTLDLLAEIGVVRPIYQGSGAAHFVLLEDGHHHHLVCVQCDTSIEFDDCALHETQREQLSTRFNFNITGHMLEIYGVCSNCQ